MASSLIGRFADRAQRIAARSPLLVRIAVLVRNQARCVIKYHLAESPDVDETGEVWIRAAVVSRAKTFVDVGANVGDWIGGIAALKGHDSFSAIAFEPSASALERLRARFAGDSRISVIDAAVGDRETTMPFLEEVQAGRGSTLVPGLTRIDGTTREVRVTTLDAAFTRYGWSGADFVKIDAEGYDARVLRGALGALKEQRIGIVQFEYNRSWQLAGETLFGAYRLLEECGYRVCLLKRDGLFTLNYARYEEYFEYSNFVAISPAWIPALASHFRGII